MGKNGGKGPECWKCGKFGHHQSECTETKVNINGVDGGRFTRSSTWRLWQLGRIDKISGEDAVRGKPKVGSKKYEGKKSFSALAEGLRK